MATMEQQERHERGAAAVVSARRGAAMLGPAMEKIGTRGGEERRRDKIWKGPTHFSILYPHFIHPTKQKTG
jgi:hypothetical protein